MLYLLLRHFLQSLSVLTKIDIPCILGYCRKPQAEKEQVQYTGRWASVVTSGMSSDPWTLRSSKLLEYCQALVHILCFDIGAACCDSDMGAKTKKTEHQLAVVTDFVEKTPKALLHQRSSLHVVISQCLLFLRATVASIFTSIVLSWV
jgi:hypothetical protein